MGKTDFKQLAKLLERANEGDEQAFQEIYHETFRPQLYYLQTVMDVPEEAADALQEVYFLLYQNMHKIDPPTILVAYLNRLSYYVGKNYVKVQRRRISRRAGLEWLEDMEETKAQELLQGLERRETDQAVRKAIGKLAEDEQAVIFMRYYQGLKHQEVALSLDITVARSKRLQQLAHKHLRELLKKEGITGWQAFFLLRAFRKTLSLDEGGSRFKLSGSGGVCTVGTGQAVLAAVALSAAVIGGGKFLGGGTQPASKQADKQPPQIMETEYVDEEFFVTFAEDESGIDFGNLYCEDEEGNVYKPHRISVKERQAAFSLPERDTTLYVCDMAGNQGKVIIRCD